MALSFHPLIFITPPSYEPPHELLDSESMQMSDGEEVSTIEVKKILGELIVGEDKKLPLSDDKLTQILGEKGYPIARRTVAKYRDQLNIAKASLRKEL